MITRKAVFAALLIGASPVVAQQFTTAAEVKPILTATKANWLALKEIDGLDYLYFTHLESWRCGLSQISYSVNGGDPIPWEVEPCYIDTQTPNAMVAEGRWPGTTFPAGHVQTVVVSVAYDDGTIDGALYERKQIVLP